MVTLVLLLQPRNCQEVKQKNFLLSWSGAWTSPLKCSAERVWIRKLLIWLKRQSATLQLFLIFISSELRFIEFFLFISLILTLFFFLQRSGNSTLAADSYNFARKLDLYDRSLNTRCCKYLLRDNRIQEAYDVHGLFMKVFFIFFLSVIQFFFQFKGNWWSYSSANFRKSIMHVWIRDGMVCTYYFSK